MVVPCLLYTLCCSPPAQYIVVCYSYTRRRMAGGRFAYSCSQSEYLRYCAFVALCVLVLSDAFMRYGWCAVRALPLRGVESFKTVRQQMGLD